ncbi:hypothetical protein XA26_45740 [Mycolicibacterium fortuitum]|uniref:Uncharacterized protein n=2 Tax=Mycolicibacterium fortuitum TaxID=1766 RepID=A0A0N9XN76_MYCFO|nr:hypothetical protein XA26_45740 [Mycolicibacterium fortuitum]
MSRNTIDPWATPASVATDDIWDPQPVAVEAATDHGPAPDLGPAYPASYAGLDAVIPPAPMTPQLVRRPDGSMWDPFAD